MVTVPLALNRVDKNRVTSPCFTFLYLSSSGFLKEVTTSFMGFQEQVNFRKVMYRAPPFSFMNPWALGVMITLIYISPEPCNGVKGFLRSLFMFTENLLLGVAHIVSEAKGGVYT